MQIPGLEIVTSQSSQGSANFTLQFNLNKSIDGAATDELSGADEVPVGTPDYSSFILKIRAAKPDVVIGGIAASDLTTFLKQWNELGMKGKIPFAEISVGNTDLWGVGPEAADGLYTITWWYKNPSNSPEEKAMAEAYMKKYNRPAADKAWMGWLGMKSLLDSIEAAKTTDAPAVVTAMENWKINDTMVKTKVCTNVGQNVGSLKAVP